MTETAIAKRPQGASPLAILGADPDRLKDLPIETVERMFALQERYEENQAKRDYAAAFLAVQAEIPVVPEKGHNTSTRSTYALLEHVAQALRPVLTKHGFSYSTSSVDGGQDGMTRFRLLVRHVGGREEAHYMDAPIDTVGMKGGATKTKLHGMKSSLTFCTRTLLGNVFGVVTSKDDDGNAGASVGPSAQPVTEKQRVELSDLVRDSGADVMRFCAYLQVKSLKEIPAGRFFEAKAVLMENQARRKAKRAATA